MKGLTILFVVSALLVPLVALGARGTIAASPRIGASSGGRVDSAVAASEFTAPPALAGPTTSFQGDFPLIVEAGDYDLTYLVLNFAPGAAIPLHYQGGPALVVGMQGMLTLRHEGGSELMLMPGDVANEEAGVRYVMTNASSANARVMAVVLLPKGAQLTTMVDTNPNPPFGPIASFQGSYPLTVEAGEYSLVNLVLDFAPGAQIPLHFHGGPVVLVGMSGTLTLRPEDGPEHTVGPGQVVSEKAGARHEMLNISAADARILAGVLLPKGAELTTLVTDTSQSAQPAGMPKTGSDDLMPTIVGLLSLALRLLILGGVLLLIRRTAR